VVRQEIAGQKPGGSPKGLPHLGVMSKQLSPKHSSAARKRGSRLESLPHIPSA
jgi:hypothetical protein